MLGCARGCFCREDLFRLFLFFDEVVCRLVRERVVRFFKSDRMTNHRCGEFDVFFLFFFVLCFQKLLDGNDRPSKKYDFRHQDDKADRDRYLIGQESRHAKEGMERRLVGMGGFFSIGLAVLDKLCAQDTRDDDLCNQNQRNHTGNQAESRKRHKINSFVCI